MAVSMPKMVLKTPSDVQQQQQPHDGREAVHRTVLARNDDGARALCRLFGILKHVRACGPGYQYTAGTRDSTEVGCDTAALDRDQQVWLRCSTRCKSP